MGLVVPLAMRFRNADGSLTLGAGWLLLTITVIWCGWGLVALIKPRLMQAYFKKSFGYEPPSIVFRFLALPVFVAGVAAAVFVLRATPGRIY